MADPGERLVQWAVAQFLSPTQSHTENYVLGITHFQENSDQWHS